MRDNGLTLQATYSTNAISGLTPQISAHDFQLSARTLATSQANLETCLQWHAEHVKRAQFNVRQIPFSQLTDWKFDENTGDLMHSSGRFFRVQGLRAKTDLAHLNGWEQPIVNQPEFGILGIIVKYFDGIPHLLMQAKVEPGNVNSVQLSPTVQATRSNYTRVHKGKTPLYLEYFIDRTRSRFIVDTLQTEQNSRFLGKRNRNMVVQVDEDFPIDEHFCWVTLGQIRRLMQIDNMVNMNARSVIACMPLESSLKASPFLPSDSSFSSVLWRSINATESLHSQNDVLSWLTEQKAIHELTIDLLPLRTLRQWQYTETEIKHCSGNSFSIIAVAVEAQREVANWSQPIVAQSNIGLAGWLAQQIDGVLHVLVQAKIEVGNLDIVEMTSTLSYLERIDMLTSNWRPAFIDYFINPPANRVRFSSIQSEEGGRFYRMLNRYMLVEMPEDEQIDVPPGFIWMTLRQVLEFVRLGFFSVEARSLLACLDLA